MDNLRSKQKPLLPSANDNYLSQVTFFLLGLDTREEETPIKNKFNFLCNNIQIRASPLKSSLHLLPCSPTLGSINDSFHVQWRNFRNWELDQFISYRNHLLTWDTQTKSIHPKVCNNFNCCELQFSPPMHRTWAILTAFQPNRNVSAYKHT